MAMRFEEHLDELLKDPEFAKAWEDSELEYQIARTILALRKSLGLTQEELAERIGTTQSSIARMESGKCQVSLSSLQKIARSCGMALEIKFRPMTSSSKVNNKLDLQEVSV
ncbi:MAG: helix-turn-helix transcriptional regulator [Firmicutes bacterium]|nr:helix-turn-helix transcriptional regulator [Bacillota bacterium]